MQLHSIYKHNTVLSPYVLTGRDRRVTRIVNSDPNSECSFLASFWPKGGARWNALRAPEWHGVRKTERDQWLSLALVPSRSRLRQTRVRKKWVGIASNPYRVHQTEYIRRQYCIFKFTIDISLPIGHSLVCGQLLVGLPQFSFCWLFCLGVRNYPTLPYAKR